MSQPITVTNLKKIKPYKKGKVRDIYEVGDNLLIVATDRISAFDCILPTGIPFKGKVLTLISDFWFNFTSSIVKNHLISTSVSDFPSLINEYKDILFSRSMLVEKTLPLAIECVVRGYLAGSGWKEYKEKGEICGNVIPMGLKESSKLPEPIFTPATKSDAGHDINITEDEAKKIIGNIFDEVKSISIEIYNAASNFASQKGIIISDTKFEFGIKDGKLLLIDEVLTPDSSRFWPQDKYEPGRAQESFDKQFVRDYLEHIAWNKLPPAPPLPDDIVKKTSEKYIEVYKRITGREWNDINS
ncbi:MAG: phosphoribosylaminoimidazolesuccinocarboxamide synthase [Candidatus Omnitrophota bacterium]